MLNINQLNLLGWQSFFQQQLDIDEWYNSVPVRVVEQHRNRLVVDSGSDTFQLPVTEKESECVVGDWLLLNENHDVNRVFERKSYFARRAAGSKLEKQAITANVDVAFVLCSLNDDFNLNRIERYLALVNEAGCEPVVMLTKADLANDGLEKREQVQNLSSMLRVEVIDCHDVALVNQLSDWLKPQTSIVLLGSSGVGKSTLSNTLAQTQQKTSAIREQDSKGRHTTTGRYLLKLASGAVLIDTPGMRELQLSDVTAGLEQTFSEIEALASSCKFVNCSHSNETKCAIQQAISDGSLTERRFLNYQKLRKENQFNTASLRERRAHDKSLTKMYKRVQSQAVKFKKLNE